jgi:hypothetical protein
VLHTRRRGRSAPRAPRIAPLRRETRLGVLRLRSRRRARAQRCANMAALEDPCYSLSQRVNLPADAAVASAVGSGDNRRGKARSAPALLRCLPAAQHARAPHHRRCARARPRLRRRERHCSRACAATPAVCVVSAHRSAH